MWGLILMSPAAPDVLISDASRQPYRYEKRRREVPAKAGTPDGLSTLIMIPHGCAFTRCRPIVAAGAGVRTVRQLSPAASGSSGRPVRGRCLAAVSFTDL